jgi:Zn-dependent protease with chaperone function
VPAIERVLARYAGEWMAVSGVVGTGIGLAGGRACITVLVARATPELRHRIPAEVEGHPVRIVETGRLHFLDAQRGHRRTSAVSAALVVVALALSGIPLSVLISPMLLAGAAVVVRLADLVATIPPDLTAWLDRAFRLLPTLWSAVHRPDVDVPWGRLAVLFVLPGTCAMLLLWAWVRLTFRRTGVGGVLRRMGGRPPRLEDLAEQRVVNLVQEVAVAAGVPPPRVLLVDTPAANVAAAGLTMEDAAVVVTRGFVDRLPRDAQQAVIAHVMGSVGNGDLAVAAEILSVLQTWGFVTLMLEAPFLRSSRESLRFVLATAARTFRGGAAASDRELALDRLLAGAGHEHGMDSEELEQLPDVHPLLLLFGYLPLLLTVGLAAIAAKAVIWLFTLVLAGPLVALLWRTRRRLADATAVQLTRHPEALADALRALAGLDVVVPAAVPVHFLFPVWDPAVDRDHSRTDVASVLLRMQLPLEPRLRRLTRLGAPAGGAVPEVPGGAAGEGLRDLAAALGWLAVAALLLAALLVLSALAAAGVLYLLGWLLDLVLVRLPSLVS